MRNICIVVMVLLFAACTKETEESYLSYTLNGKLTRYSGSFESYQNYGKGVYVTRTAGASNGRRYYQIEAMTDMSNDHIQISLNTDSLVAGTYSSGDTLHYVSSLQMKVLGSNVGWVFYSAYHARKAFIVQLTKASGGRVSGTFSGRIYSYSGTNNPADSAEISGTINNLQVRYY